MEPNAFWGRYVLGLAYEQKSMYEPAIAAFQQSAKVSGDSVMANAGLGHVYGVAGTRPRSYSPN
jgi:hypothetical protein